MYTNKEQYAAVKELNLSLAVDQTWRGDCPMCHGKNTFTVSNRKGNLLWHCYSTNCEGHKGGGARLELTPSSIKAIVKKEDQEVTPPVFKPLDRFQELGTTHTAAHRLILDYRLAPVIARGGVAVKYDPLSCRLVFLAYHGGNCYDAVGRALRTISGEPFKKWYRYAESGYGLLVRKHNRYNAALGAGITDVLVVVEDAISACVAADMGNSDALALLGTNLTERQITQMLPYKQIVLMLDPDAKVTAQALQRRIGAVRPCHLAFTKDDIKYGNAEDVAKLTMH